jgi:hypothetical protein
MPNICIAAENGNRVVNANYLTSSLKQEQLVDYDQRIVNSVFL